MKFILCNFASSRGIDEWAQRLLKGMHRHDVLEGCLREIEADQTVDSVGYGGFPNIIGEMELDASCMNGDDRAIGAVAAVRHFLPISIARRLMDKGPHVLLTGDGAERFAADCGMRREPTLSPAQSEKWKREIKPRLEGHASEPLIELVARPEMSQAGPYETVVMVVSDGQGLSCANSTSGWPWKHPGRLGDAPIPGAGFYVDSRYGWCGCTHTGEMAMRSGTARYVVSQMEFGRTIQDAVENAISDLSSLTGGMLEGVTVHAIDCSGTARVVALDIIKPVLYWYWSETMTRAECRTAEQANSSNFRRVR